MKIGQVTNKLKLLARERSVPYAQVLTQFLIERAVVRLTSDKLLKDHLIFKGGFVGLTVYHSPRHTVDLDAISSGADNEKIVIAARKAVERNIDDHVWFIFQEKIDLETQNEYGGTRLQFRMGLGEILTDLRRAQIFNLDIGTGDPVTPEPKLEETRSLVNAELISWRVYPIETIIAEKLHALAQRGSDNSRSKDIFDLAFYLPKADPKILRNAISRTFAYRREDVPQNFADYLEKLDRTMLRRGWLAAIRSVNGSEDFDKSFDEIVAALRKFEI